MNRLKQAHTHVVQKGKQHFCTLDSDRNVQSSYLFFSLHLQFLSMTSLCVSVLSDQHAFLLPAEASHGHAHQGWPKPQWQVHLQGGPLWQCRFDVSDYS